MSQSDGGKHRKKMKEFYTGMHRGLSRLDKSLKNNDSFKKVFSDPYKILKIL